MRRSLNTWLAWMEEIHPAEIELGLDRVFEVARTLGIAPLDCGAQIDTLSSQNSRLATHIVVVAGTNGKGSTIATLQNLVQRAGLTALVYTSPHFENYTERFELNGQPIDELLLCDVLEQIEAARGATPLTFFEYSTLAALQLCMDHRPDVAILEVGLGGRLDAINIVPADLAIITQIDLDHQDWLGETRELIGAEKAGILRSGGQFICADHEPTNSIKDKAIELSVDAFYLGSDFDLQRSGRALSWQSNRYETGAVVCPDPGLHLSSVAAALKAFEEIQQKTITPDDLSGLATLSLKGRQQQLVCANRLVMMDVAHNPAAVAHLRTSLQGLTHWPSAAAKSLNHGDIGDGRSIAVFAVMADKAWPEMVELISDVIDQWFLAELPGNQRAASNETIESYLQQQYPETPSTRVGSVAMALDRALAAATTQDRIIVFGSFFTVAAALAHIRSLGDYDG